MCLESWSKRTVNLTKISPNRTWGRDGYRSMNTTKCSLEIRIYSFYLCRHYLFTSIRGISATVEHRRKECWMSGSHVVWFCAVQQWCWAREPEQTMPVLRLILMPSVSLSAQETSWFQITLWQCTDIHRPLAVAQLLLPVLSDDQEWLWAQGLNSYFVVTRNAF